MSTKETRIHRNGLISYDRLVQEDGYVPSPDSEDEDRLLEAVLDDIQPKRKRRLSGPQNYSNRKSASEIGGFMEVEVLAGDALYLPSSWFHEVISSSSEDSEFHLAINHWFYPPRYGQKEIYSSSLWKDRERTMLSKLEPSL